MKFNFGPMRNKKARGLSIDEKAELFIQADNNKNKGMLKEAFDCYNKLDMTHQADMIKYDISEGLNNHNLISEFYKNAQNEKIKARDVYETTKQAKYHALMNPDKQDNSMYQIKQLVSDKEIKERTKLAAIILKYQ